MLSYESFWFRLFMCMNNIILRVYCYIAILCLCVVLVSELLLLVRVYVCVVYVCGTFKSIQELTVSAASSRLHTDPWLFPLCYRAKKFIGTWVNVLAAGFVSTRGNFFMVQHTCHASIRWQQQCSIKSLLQNFNRYIMVKLWCVVRFLSMVREWVCVWMCLCVHPCVMLRNKFVF